MSSRLLLLLTPTRCRKAAGAKTFVVAYDSLVASFLGIVQSGLIGMEFKTLSEAANVPAGEFTEDKVLNEHLK